MKSRPLLIWFCSITFGFEMECGSGLLLVNQVLQVLEVFYDVIINGLLLRLFSIPVGIKDSNKCSQLDDKEVYQTMVLPKSLHLASRFSSCLGPVTYIHTLREPNHNLAKQGVSRYGELLPMVVIICCSMLKTLRTDIRLSTSLVELALAQHHLMEIPSAKGGR
ncbi:hypothetical protein NC652_005727 [Populus alba x Populus x berolinensis]|nr:hypothetical protein NC652_005727 [Populus alba x Populus x berolinensis]